MTRHVGSAHTRSAGRAAERFISSCPDTPRMYQVLSQLEIKYKCYRPITPPIHGSPTRPLPRAEQASRCSDHVTSRQATFKHGRPDQFGDSKESQKHNHEFVIRGGETRRGGGGKNRESRERKTPKGVQWQNARGGSSQKLDT